MLYPLVSFKYSEGKGIIMGESFMEDSKVYYFEIMDWIRQYETEYPEKPFEFTIRLKYFNTSTSKMLLEIMLLLSDLYGQKTDLLTIHWYYPPNDPDMQDDIIDMADDSGLDVHIHECEADAC